MRSVWYRRRWHDFRMGHSIYLVFMMSFANFILIFHRLLIERVDWLNELMGDLWMFVVLFVFLYVPVAIVVGAWHRKNQIKVETEINMLQSPLHAKIFRTIIDMQAGRATPEEVETLRKLLKSVEDKSA